jgi:hypothetical protein
MNIFFLSVYALYALYVCSIIPLETFDNGPARLTHRDWFFLCFVALASRCNRVKNNQLDAELTLSIFRQPLHVSGVSRPITRRYNCMYVYKTTSTCYPFLDDCPLSWMDPRQQTVILILLMHSPFKPRLLERTQVNIRQNVILSFANTCTLNEQSALVQRSLTMFPPSVYARIMLADGQRKPLRPYRRKLDFQYHSVPL